MRELRDHIVEGDSVNHQLKITVTDQPGQGGACHRYEIDNFDATRNSSNFDLEEDTTGPRRLTVIFQNGPIKDVGVNGVTNEALLAIVLDRLRCFQAGPFSCEDNENAWVAARKALNALQNRTKKRISREVEGTHAV